MTSGSDYPPASRPADLPVGTALGSLRAKLDLLWRVAAEHELDVVIEEQPTPLEPIPELPAGVIEVFSLIRRVGGSYLRFAAPDAIASPAAWAARPEHLPQEPMEESLKIGYVIHGVPADLLANGTTGEAIRLDLVDGDVYYLDIDDYIFLYKHPDEDVDIPVFAPDVVTFFDECVLGPRYLEVVDTVGTWDPRHRHRKGRFKGQYTDTWLQLLVTAGLADPEP